MTTILSKQYAKCGPKIQSTTKQSMFRATNLRQSREFYTNAVGDVGDIKKICPELPPKYFLAKKKPKNLFI